MTTAPAFVWTGGTTAEVREVTLPEDRPGWVRMTVGYAGLCGTDLHVLAGEHGRALPGTVLGHEFAGRLGDGTPVFADPMVRCGSCDACQRGLRTICANLTAVGIDYPGAACREVLVPQANLFPLPATMDLRTAAIVDIHSFHHPLNSGPAAQFFYVYILFAPASASVGVLTVCKITSDGYFIDI